MSEKPTKIAFVCVENAGRSQMAAGFAREYIKKRNLEDRIKIISGGTQPAEKIHGIVRKVMEEKGINISNFEPKKIIQEEIKDCDYTITMGCSAENVCPANWKGESIDWDLPDPKNKKHKEVIKIRDQIEDKVIDLIENLNR